MASKGREGPLKLILGKPRLPQYLEFFWTAFQRLSSDRYFGPTTQGLIPWSRMDQYATRYDITGAEYDEFLHIMEGLDQTHLAHTSTPGTKGKKPGGK